MRTKPNNISARLSPDAYSKFQKIMKSRHLKSKTDTLEYIITHEDATPSEFLIFRHCQFGEEYPEDERYRRCYKNEPKKGRIVKEETCQACGLLTVIEVPLKRVQKLEEQEKDYHAKIAKLKEEYQAVNVPELQSKLKSALQRIEVLEGQKASLETDNEQLRKSQPQSKVEPKVIKEVPKIEYRDRIVEKVIEKVIEKPVEKTAYKPHPLESLQILCKAGKGFVSVTEECARNCKDFMECPYYTSIAVEKKIPQDAKLQINHSEESNPSG